RGLAASVLVRVVGGGAGAWLVQQQRQARRQDALAAVAVQLAEARNLRRQAQAQPLGDPARFRQARAAAAQALKLIDASAAAAERRPEANALRAELGGGGEAPAGGPGALAAARGRREGPTFRTDDRGLAVALAEPGADEQFRAAFRDWGLDVDAAPVAEAAARLGRRPAAVVAEVVAALDEWAGERRRQGQARAAWERPAGLAQALDDGPRAQRRRRARGPAAAGGAAAGAGPRRPRGGCGAGGGGRCGCPSAGGRARTGSGCAFWRRTPTRQPSRCWGC